MRLWFELLVCGVVCLNAAGATIAVGDAPGWTQAGRTSFERCEFKDAARAFTRALQYLPEDASLHHWLGMSYERMAEVANPLRASRDARKARVSLERAVELAPANQQYLRGLFDFYLDSPEWFNGGLDRAAVLIQRIQPDDAGAQAFLHELLAGARKEYRSPDWRMRQATLLPSREIGRVAP